MSDLNTVNFDTMTPAEFEAVLPELFSAGSSGKVSEDPRLAKFLERNPDCAALVRDLETIAAEAQRLFEQIHEPSDSLWDKIAGKLPTQSEDIADPSPS